MTNATKIIAALKVIEVNSIKGTSNNVLDA